MKYKIFLTDSIETLLNEELLGEANTYTSACEILTEGLREKGIYEEPYWRILMNTNGTFIDFGSWSRFAAIVPPVSMAVITGTAEEDLEDSE